MRKQGIDGDLITKYREKNKLTQAKFAVRLNKKLSENGIDSNYSDKAISMWENGNRKPADINVLKALAKIIGVSLDELCLMNDEDKNEITQQDSSSDIKEEKLLDYVNDFINTNQQEILDCKALGMYNCAKTKERVCVDGNNIKEVKEFWLSIPLEPLSNGDVAWASQYMWYDGYALFEEYTKGAKQVSEKEFKVLILNYLLDNAQNLKENYDENVAVDYVNYRFEGGIHRDYYDMFLSDELSSLKIDVNDVDVYPIQDFYTNKGLLLKMGVEITGKASSLIKILACNVLDDSDKWTELNQKSIEELLKE